MDATVLREDKMLHDICLICSREMALLSAPGQPRGASDTIWLHKEQDKFADRQRLVNTHVFSEHRDRGN